MPSGVYERTEEHNRKNSEGHKGKHHTDAAKKKMSDAKSGKKISKETRQKMSDAKSGENNPMYGRTGEKAPIFGKHHTDAAKKKMSDAAKLRISEKNPMYNKKHSPETRKKIGDKNKKNWQDPEYRNKLTEENHYNWNPNREEVYAPYGENFYDKESRNEKWKFQNGRDMLTGTKLDSKKRNDYHHIDYDKSNDDPNNHCFISINNHARITGYQKNLIRSERYKKILQENTLALKKGQIPKYWSQINKELFRQEKLKQLDLSSYII